MWVRCELKGSREVGRGNVATRVRYPGYGGETEFDIFDGVSAELVPRCPLVGSRAMCFLIYPGYTSIFAISRDRNSTLRGNRGCTVNSCSLGRLGRFGGWAQLVFVLAIARLQFAVPWLIWGRGGFGEDGHSSCFFVGLYGSTHYDPHWWHIQ